MKIPRFSGNYLTCVARICNPWGKRSSRPRLSETPVGTTGSQTDCKFVSIAPWTSPKASSVLRLAGTLLLFPAIFGVEARGHGLETLPGRPFTNFVVAPVNTLSPRGNATVQMNFDGSAVHFAFGIPHGMDGPQGAPGEVTNSDLRHRRRERLDQHKCRGHAGRRLFRPAHAGRSGNRARKAE